VTGVLKKNNLWFREIAVVILIAIKNQKAFIESENLNSRRPIY